MTFTQILDWILSDPSHLVAIASALSAIIPTPSANSIAGKIFKIIDLLALNIWHAKDKGPDSPPSTPPQVPPQSPPPAPAGTVAIAASMLLCVILPACTGKSQATEVFELRASYDAVALAPMVRYHALPVCGSDTSAICRDRTIDQQLIHADTLVLQGLDLAEAAAKDPASTTLTIRLAEVRTAIQLVTELLSHNNIK